MTDFSLRKLVREVMTEAPSPDNRVLAKEVARRVPSEQVDAVLVEALAEYVRHYQTTVRPTFGTGGQKGAGQANSGRSGKVAAIRSAFRRMLDEAPYDTATGRKLLGDCTADDLIFIAEGLEEQARQSMAKAGGFRDLSAVMAKNKAKKLRDLSDSVLAQYLGGAAA